MKAHIGTILSAFEEVGCRLLQSDAVPIFFFWFLTIIGGILIGAEILR